jgi:hypothetical protein
MRSRCGRVLNVNDLSSNSELNKIYVNVVVWPVKPSGQVMAMASIY